MRRRILVAVQAILSVTAVVCALGIIRSDVVEQTTGLAQPVDVAAGDSADIQVSYGDAVEPLEGSFRVVEITDHPRLTPTTEYEDPIEQEGGRVVVAGIECDCPISDELLTPTATMMDASGRDWQEDQITQPNPDDYAELEGYSPGYRFGEETPYRYAVVFVVPADVAGEVRLVLHRDPGPAYRFAR